MLPKRWRPGLRLGPRWGSLQRSLGPRIGDALLLKREGKQGSEGKERYENEGEGKGGEAPSYYFLKFDH